MDQRIVIPLASLFLMLSMPPTRESAPCVPEPWTRSIGPTSQLILPELVTSVQIATRQPNPTQCSLQITSHLQTTHFKQSTASMQTATTLLSTAYIVIKDRYSNWPMVFRSESGAEGLVRYLRETFVTFGIPEELTSDGGPQFKAGKTQECFREWGVRHGITSVANPHANCRAELAVKTVKRMLMDNVSGTASLEVDKFQGALLMHRNTVDPETKASPALSLL